MKVTLVAVALCIATAAVGFASSLGLTSQSVAVATVATTVPVESCTVGAAADTYAQQNASGSNFGTATDLYVRSERLNRNRRAFIRFDLGTCAIPSSARVKSATLNLFMTVAPGAARTHNIHALTSSWVETTLTWTAQPTAAGSTTSTASTGTTANATVAFDVRSDVASFVSGSTTNNGWRISDSVEGSSTAREARFSSREHATSAQRPSLVVTWYP